MELYILIGSIIALAFWKVAKAIFSCIWYKQIKNALKGTKYFKWVVPVLPIMFALVIVFIWPLLIIEEIVLTIIIQINKKKVKQMANKAVKVLDEAVETFEECSKEV